MSAHAQPHFHRALFVRLDRIGDLVLTLPTDQSLNIDTVDWWIPKGLSFVTNAALPQRSSSELSKRQTLSDALKLASLIRTKRYDFVVVFQAPWWVGLVVWLAKIPVRVGVQSQWHSFIFFNRGVRQKRSRAEVSELEYGYRLLEEGLGLPRQTLARTTLKLKSKSGPSALDEIASKTSQKTRLVPLNYYVVHPGMGGSALNWPVEKYAALIRELAREMHVVITGTASDEKFLAPLKDLLRDDESENIIWLDGKLSGDELISVLENSRGVVAPSTGVVHLAASTGRPTVGIYSQVPVERAIRWGPQGERVGVVEAPRDGARADDFQHGMTLIEVSDVVRKLRELGA